MEFSPVHNDSFSSSNGDDGEVESDESGVLNSSGTDESLNNSMSSNLSLSDSILVQEGAEEEVDTDPFSSELDFRESNVSSPVSSPMAAALSRSDDDEDEEDVSQHTSSQSDGVEYIYHSSPVTDNYEESDDEDIVQETEQSTAKTQKRGTALSFLGQLTPGTSSTTKYDPRGPTCTTWSSFRKLSVSATLCSKEPMCPVPKLAWTSKEKFWEAMCQKDDKSIQLRNPDVFEYQTDLHPRMRAILIDWLAEVADVYSFHRETFHLTIDYIDRYLCTSPNVQRAQLQLIGITCLYLACKVEEIYPPKVEVFSAVTDCSCTTEEIFAMEIVILQHLDWSLSPITSVYWAEMMLQFMYEASGNTSSSDVLQPHFSGVLFKRICGLLDLALMDVASLQFSYGVLAAAAIYILVDPDLALSVSGLKKEDLDPCVQWMSVHWYIIFSQNPHNYIDLKDLPKGCVKQFFGKYSPMLQTHSSTIHLYDLSQVELRRMMSDEHDLEQSQALTPPSSCSKVSPQKTTVKTNEETPSC